MSSEQRSNRRPWVRSGLMGVVVPLLPLVWVVEVGSCGQGVPEEVTGTKIASTIGVEGWLMSAPVLLVLALIPFLAPLIQRLGIRVWVHVLGLIAAGLTGWSGAVIMFFTIFAERTPTLVGLVVLAVFAALFIDALLRVVWSTQEWMRFRASTTKPG